MCLEDELDQAINSPRKGKQTPRDEPRDERRVSLARAWKPWRRERGRGAEGGGSESIGTFRLEVKMNGDRSRPKVAALDHFTDLDEPAIVCGVLYKYVNLASGWRPRCFVLQDKILRYFKVSGDKLSNMTYITDYCRNNGQVEFIGELTTRFETDARAQFKPSQQKHIEDLEEKGSVHVEVAKFRASGSDLRKFYVHSGTMTLMLKAESSSERSAWLNALQSERTAAKTPKTPLPKTPATPAVATVLATSDHIREDVKRFMDLMRANEASDELLIEVETLLQNIQAKVMDQLYVEREKRVKLLDYVKALENDKQDLESKLLVENHTRISLSGSAHAPSSAAFHERAGSVDDSEGEEGFQDDNVASSDDENEAAAGLVGSDQDDDDDFYDCTDRESFSDDFAGLSSASASAEPGSGLPMPEGLESAPRRHRRIKLPDPAEKEKKVSLWTIIRDMVGKDLTRVCLPVYFNEPISALQKLCEDFVYLDLLDKAAASKKGSLERMMFVCGFAVSGYSNTEGRTRKPFNPLLGETFEYLSPEKGFRFFSEKVVHHPTILAAVAEGRGWKWDTAGELKSKFWGRSVEVIPVGTLTLKFHDGEVITYNKVTTLVNNIIIGKMKIENSGPMKIESTLGVKAKIKFKETGILDRAPHLLKGYIQDRDGNKVATLRGQWSKDLMVEHQGGEECVWKHTMKPEGEPGSRNLPKFTMTLNELFEDERATICPTDTRLRPDQHFLEVGQYSKANDEKLRVEQKQRAARKAAEQGEGYKPKWFTLAPGSNPKKWKFDSTFHYTDEYWQARETGDFGRCQDIFG